jgi:hypothetical protein
MRSVFFGPAFLFLFVRRCTMRSIGPCRFFFFLPLVPLFFLTPHVSRAQDKPLALGFGRRI